MGNSISGLLGQVAPGAAAEVDLYKCPPNTIATLRVIISNRAGATSFKVLAVKGGVASETKHELASAVPVAANEPGSTIGFVISSGDVIRVSSASGSCSFTATGETRAE